MARTQGIHTFRAASLEGLDMKLLNLADKERIISVSHSLTGNIGYSVVVITEAKDA